MLIHQVVLTNFKSYAQAEVTFAPGTVAIVGPNGAGKSSLLDAIGLVLFDCQRGTYAERLHEGARKGAVQARISSSLDERTYDVRREFTDRATTRYVVSDVELAGRVLAEGVEQVTAWLREHLRVESSPGLAVLFETTIGVAQGTFTAPFLEPAAVRKALFDPLLQVDAYRTAYEALRPTQRYLAERQQETARAIAHMAGQLADLPQRQRRLDVVLSRLEDLQVELRQYESALAALEPQAAVLEAQRERAQEASAAQRQAEMDLQRQEERVSEARDTLRQAQIAQETLTQSAPGHRAYVAADARLAELEEKRETRETLRQKRAQLWTEEARLHERAAAAAESLERGRTAAAKAEALQPQVEQQQRLEQQLRTAKERAGEALALERRISELEQETKQELESLQALRDEATRARKLAAEHAQVEREIASLTERNNSLRDEIARLRASLEQISSQTRALQQAAAICPTCEQTLPESRRQELLARNAADQERLQRELGRATERTTDMAREERALKDRLHRLQAALRAAPSAGELARAEKRCAESIRALDQTRQTRKRLGDAEQVAAELRAALEGLGDPRAEQQAARRTAQDAATAERVLTSSRAKLAAVQEEIRKVEASLAVYDGLDEAMVQAREECERHRNDHEAYLGSRQAAQALPQAQHHLGEQEAALRALSARRDAAVQTATLAAQAYDANQHQRILGELRAARERVAATKAQQQTLEEQREHLREGIRELSRIQEEMRSQQETLAESLATSDLLAYLRDLLRDAGPLVTQRLIRRISHQAAEIYGELMGQTDGRLVWGEDYGLRLDLGDEQRSYEQLSGGERMAAALAVRMALLRETSAVDVAFFDEPTAHLDSERRESLAERIMSVRGFSQLFVISHDDTFEQAAQSYVRIWRDARGSHTQP